MRIDSLARSRPQAAACRLAFAVSWLACLLAAPLRADLATDATTRVSVDASELAADPSSVIRLDAQERPTRRLRADFASFDALLMVYMEDWADTLAGLLSLVPDDVEPVLLAGEEEAPGIEAWLGSKGIDPSKVAVEVVDLDSPWVRDYAPLQLLGDDASITWVDAIYHSDRPMDDSLPKLLQHRFPVRHQQLSVLLDGGALISNGRGLCATTRGAMDDGGVDLASATQRSWLLRGLGCDALVVLPVLTEEPTRHADVMAQFLDEDTVAVGEMSHDSHPADARVLDVAAALLQSGGRALGQEIEIVRVPIERGAEDIYYSWVNGLRMGDLFVVPHFEAVASEVEERAHRALAGAMPDVTLVPLESESMIRMGGAIHCITAQLNGRRPRRLARARRGPAPEATPCEPRVCQPIQQGLPPGHLH